MGWAHRRRDHGGLIFVDVRDRTGLSQCVFNPTTSAAAHTKAEAIRNEFVLAIHGVVQRRPAGTENTKLATGEVEVQVSDLRVLNDARAHRGRGRDRRADPAHVSVPGLATAPPVPQLRRP
jgi:aspartyl-tRNA synthetase